MSDAPNNFPCEGQHNPVTQGALEALENQRSTPEATLEYTIGGATETIVHSNIESERSYALQTGYRRFEDASNDLHTQHAMTKNDGHAKEQFNFNKEQQKTYADMQREAAANARSRDQIQERGR